MGFNRVSKLLKVWEILHVVYISCESVEVWKLQQFGLCTKSEINCDWKGKRDIVNYER